MEIPFFLVDTFSSRPFTGATTAVLFPPAPPEDGTHAPIVAELGAHDGAYVFPRDGAYRIRWFDRHGELSLCTHAAIAAAHVIVTTMDRTTEKVAFSSPGGPIDVVPQGEHLVTDLPLLAPGPCEPPPALARALRVPPVEVLRAGKYVVIYADETDLRVMAPTPAELAKLDAPGIIATAPGKEHDYVCRTFAIANGRVEEEQVSASAQSRLVPYWAKRLGKTALSAAQLSPRHAELVCEEFGGRVHVAARARCVAKGTYFA